VIESVARAAIQAASHLSPRSKTRTAASSASVSRRRPQLSVIGTKLASRTGGARMQTEATTALIPAPKRCRSSAYRARERSR